MGKNRIFELYISKKKLILTLICIAAVLAVSLCCRSTVKYVACMVMLLGLGGLFGLKVKGRFSFLLWPLAALAFGAFGIALGQNVNGYSPVLPAEQYLLGVEVAMVFMLLFYAIVQVFVKDMPACAKTAIIAVSVLFLLLNIVNYYTVDLRGKGISPQDFFSIRTAANVVGEYEIKLTADIRNSVSLLIVSLLFLLGLKTDAPKMNLKRKFIPVIFALLLTLHFHSAVQHVQLKYWGDEGTSCNGLMLNLAGQLDQSRQKKPEKYSKQMIDALEAEYPAAESAITPGNMPHIIVIMNECWSDLRVWDEFETDVPVLPVFDGLSENTVKGYVLTSIYGGMTPDSEYEFLTGNSVSALSPSSVPYVQYLKENVWSIERYLDAMGYRSFYTHPANSVNYDRNIAVPSLGFEETVFEDEYADSERKRVFVSDAALFDRLISEYNESKGEDKLFAFAVSMQNHSPFAEKEEFDETVSLVETGIFGQGSDYVEDYLSCIHESDRQFGRLTEYFANVDEPVLLVMYGDHQPNISGISADSEALYADDMTKYVVPFIIWANFDIEEQYVELTSLNFLSNYLLKTAGLPMSPYNSFLEDVQEVIPAMNAYGYWSDSLGRFAGYDEAEGEEKQWLQDYEILQYNSLFDKKNRSEVFFPEN